MNSVPAITAKHITNAKISLPRLVRTNSHGQKHALAQRAIVGRLITEKSTTATVTTLLNQTTVHGIDCFQSLPPLCVDKVILNVKNLNNTRRHVPPTKTKR